MNPIRATWINGQIQPAEPIDWPEGITLIVEPISPSAPHVGMTEEEWKSDSESIAAWVEAIEGIQPLEYSEDELREAERRGDERRRWNLEAVRREMAEMRDVDIVDGKTP